MNLSFVPDYKFKAVTDISAAFLQKRGIELLLLDLDNTIAPYGAKLPTDEILQWAGELQGAGITLYFVSNSKKQWRVSAFADELGVGYIYRAKKPSSRAISALLRELKTSESCTALAGDQIFTDVLASNGAGITSIVVHPIRFTNPFLAVRFALELPFRAMRRPQKTDTKE